MMQKVIKVGNSLAVTLPREFVKNRKVKPGQQVLVEADADLDLMQIRTSSSTKLNLTPEFKLWLGSIGKKYSRVIKDLAKV